MRASVDKLAGAFFSVNRSFYGEQYYNKAQSVLLKLSCCLYIVYKEIKKLMENCRCLWRNLRMVAGFFVGVFKLLCDKHSCLCYYKNDISENDFCGNESIFIFFMRILPIVKINTCKFDY